MYLVNLTSLAMTENDSRAKILWNILAGAILTRRCSKESKCRRSYTSFYGLFNIDQVSKPEPDGGGILPLYHDVYHSGVEYLNWNLYSLQHTSMKCTLYIRHIPQKLSPVILNGFNNTGNICVWAAEELMAYYCSVNRHLFQKKRVCELGGGMTCLAGLCIANLVKVEKLLLSDGNSASVANLNKIINANKDGLLTSNISTCTLCWPPEADISHLQSTFDFILCADCLFFDEGRQDLVNLLYFLLSSQGKVIIFAPRRGKTLDTFVELASVRFSICVSTKYDNFITQLHNEIKTNDTFDDDIHYPLLIEMVKQRIS